MHYNIFNKKTHILPPQIVGINMSQKKSRYTIIGYLGAAKTNCMLLHIQLHATTPIGVPTILLLV